MPTFLDNSLNGLNQGWQQMYGQPAVGVTPATPVSQPAPVVATPVSVNPMVSGSPDMPQILPLSQILGGTPVSGPAPIAYNPEIGQPLGATGGDNSSGGLLSWLQNFFSSLGIGGAPQAQQPVSTNAPTLDSNIQVGPPTPTMPQAAQTTGGVATTSPGIDAANAANTSFGGGGGPNIGSSILGGIGSGLSNVGKGISAAQSTYTAPNIPLPKQVTFVPPNLAPNTKASY
jgi:hypothetical protein